MRKQSVATNHRPYELRFMDGPFYQAGSFPDENGFSSTAMRVTVETTGGRFVVRMEIASNVDPDTWTVADLGYDFDEDGKYEEEVEENDVEAVVGYYVYRCRKECQELREHGRPEAEELGITEEDLRVQWALNSLRLRGEELPKVAA